MSKRRALLRSRPNADHVIIGIGLFLLLWKIHAFELPFQWRTGAKTSLFGKLLDWLSPWRWRRGDLLTGTTPTGGDMGAHVWTPDVLKRSMFPHWRITGWSDEWFAGMPVLRFYFPLPITSIALLSYVLPYGLAFKLVTVAGIVSLPVVSYRFGRLVGFARPTPLFLALAAFLYLFGRWYDSFIYGGGVLPTMAGEFSFSISLSLAVLFLGWYVRVLRDGVGQRRSALLLACTGLSHLLPTLWVLTTATVITGAFLLRRDRVTVLKRAAGVAITGALLGAWWILPFAASLPYTNDMGWEKATKYRDFLFPFLATKPPADAQVVAFAFVGVALAAGSMLALVLRRALILRRDRSIDRVASSSIDVPNSIDELSSIDVSTPDVSSSIDAPTPDVPALRAPDERRPVPKTATGAADVPKMVTASLLVVGAASALLFRFSPQYRLWNARILPFWFLMVLFVGAIGFAQLRRFTESRKVAVGSLSTLMALGLPLGLLPGWMPVPKLGAGVVGLQRARTAAQGHAATVWTGHNFEGYERQSGWPEYRELMNVANSVGKTHGCGRVMWEHEEVRFATYGTTLSLMLLPFWTRGCMGSMDGVYFESSATLPQHWLTASLVSAPKTDDAANGRVYSGATDPQRNLPYATFDLGRAVPMLRAAGVRYFLSVTPETTGIARQMTKDFAPLATSGPYTFFRVLGSELVSALPSEPVILEGIGQSQDDGWLDVGAAAFATPNQFPAVMVASGPTSWQRAQVRVEQLGSVRQFGAATSIAKVKDRLLPPVRVSNIRSTGTRLTFDVARVGVPIAVNTSFMPNWHARGALGPYRSQPNFMVVVPTTKRVVLTYESTPAETGGRVLTGLGILLLVPWRRARPRRARRPKTVIAHNN